jgi:hypothetical protein
MRTETKSETELRSGQQTKTYRFDGVRNFQMRHTNVQISLFCDGK